MQNTMITLSSQFSSLFLKKASSKASLSSGSWSAFADDKMSSSGTRISTYPAPMDSFAAIPIKGRPFLNWKIDRDTLGLTISPFSVKNS